MPYAEVEKYGQSKLLNILRVDVAAVNAAAASYPSIWISSVIVMGVMTYLIYIDFKVFLYVASIASVSILIFRIPFSIGTKKIAQSREYADKIQESVKGLIFGAKELGLNRKRAEDYYHNELYSTERELRKLGVIASAFIQLADHFGELMTFIIIAVVIFHFPYVFAISQGELIAVVISLVYLSNPISQIMSAAGAIQHGKVSLNKLQEFYKCTQRELDIQPVADDWLHYTIRDLTYIYSKEEDSFGLHVANATFKKGQITYIVGGNGSGKSTLSKCLTLHYIPTEGHICFDNKVIQPKQMEAARQQISAIYSDYYLFNKLHGIDYESTKSKIDSYLKMLELEGKVTLTDGRFSTTSLSDGQKKRLALLVLLLEDRQICLFDEWAADQDPRFKQIFYAKILPELKSRNKVVIVITHDDRFFHLADQLIMMEYGKVKSIVDIKKTDTQVPALA
jgi:putative ATP-binding cassette transporter